MATCYKTKKQSFPTRIEAAIDRVRIIKNETGHRHMAQREVPVRDYQCEFCHSWHHTSQAKNESRLARR